MFNLVDFVAAGVDSVASCGDKIDRAVDFVASVYEVLATVVMLAL